MCLPEKQEQNKINYELVTNLDSPDIQNIVRIRCM